MVGVDFEVNFTEIVFPDTVLPILWSVNESPSLIFFRIVPPIDVAFCRAISSLSIISGRPGSIVVSEVAPNVPLTNSKSFTPENAAVSLP